VVVAAGLVAPLEAAKVRVMVADDAPTLRAAVAAVATDEATGAVAPGRLWAGFGPILLREFPFTSAKLLVSLSGVLFPSRPGVTPAADAGTRPRSSAYSRSSPPRASGPRSRSA